MGGGGVALWLNVFAINTGGVLIWNSSDNVNNQSFIKSMYDMGHLYHVSMGVFCK